MSDEINPCCSRFKKLAIGVCFSATIVSGFMGYLASLLYSLKPVEGYVGLVRKIGIVWGSTCGLYAGILWCRWMAKRIQTGEITGLGEYGKSQGIKAGALATVFLHTGLLFTAGLISGFGPLSGDWFLVTLLAVMEALCIGLLFGLPAGHILGAIFGSECQDLVEDIVKEQANTILDEEPNV